MSPTRITLSVSTDQQEQITRSVEVLGRALAGLALDGIDGVLMAMDDDEEMGE